MEKIFSLLVTLIAFSTFSQEEREIMYRIFDENNEECGYVNAKGDTLFPIGTFVHCFSDSVDYAIVIKREKSNYAFPIIDSKGNTMCGAYVFDNGPDYVEDGTFRIVKDGKIGYMTIQGDVIVEPIYEGAWPFKNGRAEVSLKAEKESDGEHSWWVGGDWYYIDKNGNRHTNQSDEN